MAISTIGTDALASAAVTSAKLASGAPSRSQLPAGTVLQVVQATTTTQITTTSTTMVTTGFSASITPTSSTSKILVLHSASSYVGASGQPVVTIARNGTNVLGGEAAFSQNYGNGVAVSGTLNFSYLDAPATTSATTYTVYFKNANNSTTVYYNATISTNSTASIILMEIAA